MRLSFAMLAVALLAALPSCNEPSVQAALAAAPAATDVDPVAVKKLIVEGVYPSFGQVQTNPDAMRRLLSRNVRIRWPNKMIDGADAFLKSIAEAFAKDRELFAVAVRNYKMLVTTCGKTDVGLRPVGLPASVDVASFDPTAIGPEALAAHPGLLAPSFAPVKMLQGDQLAANRFLVVAHFKHSWMTGAQEPYLFVDRWVVGREGGALKVQEYEFTLNMGEFPVEPTPLTACP